MSDNVDQSLSVVRGRWLSPEIAMREVEAFSKKFGAKHLALACHGALPLIITPELLNLIHINFLDAMNIAWIAEADIALSPLCRPVDEGVYEFEPSVREVLLTELEKRFGKARTLELADFLMIYLERRRDRRHDRDIARSYRWIAEAYLYPEDAIATLGNNLEQASQPYEGYGIRRADQIRIVNMTEILASPLLRGGLKEKYQTVLEKSRTLAQRLYNRRPVNATGTRPGASAGEVSEVSFAGGRIRMTFAYIPPGTFMMGSPEDEPGRYSDEKLHEVTLNRGFYMQTTPVTQGQWKALMGNNPSRFKECGDDCPVENVSWNDVQEFIKKLNELEGGGNKYRLPTEAEWEYAARAGTTTPFAFGKCLSTDEANYNGNYPLEGCPKGKYRGKTTPVGSLKANAWGLYDMHGNVWEWCEDWYGDYPDGSVTDPVGSKTGSVRVIRGGSWNHGARTCRAATRPGYSPDYRDDGLGFRLCFF